MPIARLQGPPEHVLELEPLRYEFSRTATSTGGFDWDANWVVVRIAVQDSSRRWACVDPAFLTTELQKLATWLRAVANHESVEPDFTPTEPLLSFEIRPADEAVSVRANFALELEPPSGDPWLDFRLRPEALHQFADDLATAAAPFPPR